MVGNIHRVGNELRIVAPRDSIEALVQSSRRLCKNILLSPRRPYNDWTETQCYLSGLQYVLSTKWEREREREMKYLERASSSGFAVFHYREEGESAGDVKICDGIHLLHQSRRCRRSCSPHSCCWKSPDHHRQPRPHLPVRMNQALTHPPACLLRKIHPSCKH